MLGVPLNHSSAEAYQLRSQFDSSWCFCCTMAQRNPAGKRNVPPGGGGEARSRSGDAQGQRPLWLRPRHERYLRLQEIGHGNFGKVYTGIDLLSDQPVAIKVQAPDSESCQEEFGMLRFLSSCPHPHVVTLLDYFTQESRGAVLFHMVYPLADSTLWHVFKHSRTPLGDARIAHLLRGVAAGLGHLHNFSIVHGDASLKNMLLMRSGEVCVGDFGAAHSAANFVFDADTEITTQYVRAPERLLGGVLSATCMDIWAFGVMFWCLRVLACDWLLVSDGNIANHLAALMDAIGPVPAECALRECPLWSSVHPRIRAGAGEGYLERLAPWGSTALQVLDRTLLWEPSARWSAAEILESRYFCKCEGGAQSAAAASPSTDAATARPNTADDEIKEAKPMPADEAATSQNAPAGEAAASQTLCVCNGNCGSRVHKKAANARYRVGHSSVQICQSVAEGSFAYCRRCRCEVSGCAYQRKGSLRWCQRHNAALGAQQYAVPTGVQSYRKAWTPVTRLIARAGHLLQFMEPTDCTQLLQLMAEIAPIRLGQPLGVRMSWVFVAHLIKIPPVVREFGRRLSEFPEGTPAEMLTLFQGMLDYASGKQWPQTFSRGGGGDFATGLAVHAARLHLVQPPGNQPRKRAKGKRKSEDADASDAVTAENVIVLGPSRTPYEKTGEAEPALEIFAEIQRLFSSPDLCWPAAACDVPAFADNLLEKVLAARSFASTCGRATLTGGSPTHAYNAKSFVRICLLGLERSLPGCFDAVPFSSLSRWCPDMRDHAGAVAPQALCSEVLETFGVNPLMWHCWACLLGKSAAADVLAALKVGDAVLWDAFLQHEVLAASGNEDSFMPGLHIIIAGLAARS